MRDRAAKANADAGTARNTSDDRCALPPVAASRSNVPVSVRLVLPYIACRQRCVDVARSETTAFFPGSLSSHVSTVRTGCSRVVTETGTSVPSRHSPLIATRKPESAKDRDERRRAQLVHLILTPQHWLNFDLIRPFQHGKLMARRDFQNRKLDATVERHAFFGAVVRDRTALAKALRFEPPRLDAAKQQELEHCTCPPLRQVQVVCIVGTEVAVTSIRISSHSGCA